MTAIALNIANFLLEVQFFQVKERLAKEVMGVFLPFMQNNSRQPDEILEVVFIRPRNRIQVESTWEFLIKECLERPLRKFPFTYDYPIDRHSLFLKAKPFFQNEIFYQFLKNMSNPKALSIFPVPQGWLVRDHLRARSCLLLKQTMNWQKPLRSILPAVYFITAQILPDLNSVMLHGVGIRRNKEELLFLGGSGDGKSTLSKLLDQGDVISDDAIIVTQNDQGVNLKATPFSQTYPSCKENRLWIPIHKRLAAGFFLRKSERNFLENVSHGEAGSIILKNHIHFFRYFPKDVAQKTFFLISAICRKIPFYRLNFKKDPSFWQQIDNQLKNDLLKNEENIHE